MSAQPSDPRLYPPAPRPTVEVYDSEFTDREPNLFSTQDLPPLCVDLDGTLVKSDTLVDSVLALARSNPRALLAVPGWLRQGKAALKQHVARAAPLDVTVLPYNQPLLTFLFQQHAAGRTLYLATAADSVLAERVAAYQGIFAGVLASDGEHNLAGGNKLAAFRRQFGERFSYIGNARPDLSILTACQQPMVANPTPALLAGLRAARITPFQTFEDRAATGTAWLRAIRLHQWAKNTLILVPFLLAHAWRETHAAGAALGALLAFLSFGLCASATYIVNDLLDIEADRRHTRKRRRPFAAGDLSAIQGCMVVAGFLLVSFALALLIPHIAGGAVAAAPLAFLKWLVIYALTTTAYSFYLKRVVLVDVIVLSGLYTIRIIAGSKATGVPVSTWLAGFSIFFFLSLAFVKRFAELENLRMRELAPSNGRGYLLADIEQLRSLGTAAGYASVVVLTLYISALDTRLYHHPIRLWLMVPVLLLWVSQLWLLASRGDLNEDPVVYAITDKRSLLLGLAVIAVVFSAM